MSRRLVLACAEKAVGAYAAAGVCSTSLASSSRQALNTTTASAATSFSGLCRTTRMFLACATAPWAIAVHHRSIATSPRAAFAAPSLEKLERQVEQLCEQVQRLEAAEASRSALGRLLTLLDSARLDPLLVNAAAVGEMFTPAAKVDVGNLGSAVSAEQVLPLLQKLATQGGQGRRHVTNIVTEPSRHDPSIIKAKAYCLVVEPVAGAKPVATSMQTLKCRMEKGLDDKWRIKQLTFVEAEGST